jgi:dolichol-phosphate mannosyltransferase
MDFTTEFSMKPRFLTALPVFNEASSVMTVLDEVLRFSDHVLVVDDGSTDGTDELLSQRQDVQVVRHKTNRGYGSALLTAFDYAISGGYATIVTIDCDGQHEPQRIPRFVSACQNVDIVSGSRYLKRYPKDSAPPAERRHVNQLVTADINEGLGLELTDAFCGFKAYRVEALEQLRLTETGYGMPLQLWVEAAANNLRIIELPVPLIYLDAKRSFGGALDDAETRLAYYRDVICRSLALAERRLGFQASGKLKERAGCS